MKQSRLMSMLETSLSTAAGFGLSLLIQWLVLPLLLHVEIPLQTNIAFALIMTVVSLLRGFVLRRVFEAFHIRRPLSPFMNAVIAERFRQIEQEGWSTDHDDGHGTGVLARAGAAYALGEEVIYCERWQDGATVEVTGRLIFPWDIDWWKISDGPRRNWVKAAALILAEGEKLDRRRRGSR